MMESRFLLLTTQFWYNVPLYFHGFSPNQFPNMQKGVYSCVLNYILIHSNLTRHPFVSVINNFTQIKKSYLEVGELNITRFFTQGMCVRYIYIYIVI